MAAKQAAITQANARRLFKAARDAGFSRAILRTLPDGRVEVVADDGVSTPVEANVSPFEQWKAENADKA